MPLPSFPGSDLGDEEVRVESEGLHQVLRPIVAGARARGIVDGLELIGLGVLLLDATGGVLHASDRGRRMLSGWASLVGDHVVAENAADSRAVQDLIGDVIGLERHDPQNQIIIRRQGGKAGVIVRAFRFGTGEGEAQRLRAVIVLEEYHAA